ncbi:MAG: DUF86 domain-containing protein [Syntrophobacteraceae bacterium]
MKDPRVYLAHMLECIERIEIYTKEGRKVFFATGMIQDAVVRNLEVIGEAAGRVSTEYQAAHPEIPWRSIIGMRNILIHDYAGVDLDQVWQVVEQDLTTLKSALLAFLPPLEQLEAEITEQG